MKSKELYDYISTLVDYCPIEGQMYWNQPRANNRIKQGDPVGSIGANGYHVVTFSYEGKIRSVLTHRLAWYIIYGTLPRRLDHANGDKSDYRIENIRECTASENRMNARVRSDNASKVTGVYFRKDCGKWRAEITKDGDRRHLGFFETKEDAVKARKDAEIELFGDFSVENRKPNPKPLKKIERLGRSGVRHVTWHKGVNKWQARPIIEGKPISLGLFDTVEEASAKIESWKKSFDNFFK